MKDIKHFIPTWMKRKDEWLPLSGSARALWFVESVEDKSLPACLRVKQSCKLFRRWSKQYTWDPQAVDKMVGYIEKLKTPEGALDNFTVLPWQAFMTAAIHGFVREDGKRACREVLLVVPRKSGKSSFVATLMMQELVRPFGGIKSPTIACIGVNEETAGMTFNKARAILVHDREFKGNQGFVGTHKMSPLSKEIKCGKNNGRMFMITLGSRSLEGHTLTAYVADEISRLPDRSTLGVIRSGMHHARAPLLIMTSTPSDRFNSALDDETLEALRILEEEDDRPGYFPIIFRAEVDELDDAGDPHLWEKCQPSLGWGELDAEKYHIDWMRARATSGGRHEFYTRQLCAPVKPSGVWITAEQIEQTPNPPDAPERQPNDRIIIGLDLAEVRDLTSIAILAYNDETEMARLWFEVHAPSAWLPAAEVTAREDMRRREWSEGGWLKVHPGGAIDFERLAKRLDELVKKLRPLGIYSDSHSAVIETSFRASERTAALMRTLSKSKRELAEPMNLIVSMVENERISVQKHPVFLNHVGNVNLEQDKYGGRMIGKETHDSPHNIDCVDSALMAFAGYARSKDLAQAGEAHAPAILPKELPGQGKVPMFLGED